MIGLHCMKKYMFFVALILASGLPFAGMAQNADPVAVVDEVATDEAAMDIEEMETDAELVTETDAVSASARESIFFSIDELEMILQAAEGNFEQVEDVDDPSAPAADPQPVDRGRRVLALSGIVYQSPQDWTIWLNGERVTPKNIPENVRGLIVQTDNIRLRWLDKAENRIVNITLRPHQQYNLDLDLILPGTR